MHTRHFLQLIALSALWGGFFSLLRIASPALGPWLLADIREGAVLRVRPKAMTVAVILAGLPILWGSGTGSEVMQRSPRPWWAAW